MLIPSKISRIISGSCTPASDLSAMVFNGNIKERDALRALNEKTIPAYRLNTLQEYVQRENDFMKNFGI